MKANYTDKRLAQMGYFIGVRNEFPWHGYKSLRVNVSVSRSHATKLPKRLSPVDGFSMSNIMRYLT
jgi:hypothetical protein